MSSRTYSARELLRFRHVPLSEDVSDRLAARAEEDFDLAEIIRASSAKPRSLIVEGGSGSEPDDRDRLRRGPAQQLDGTDSERKFRGRTESEHERGPITAPSDLAAQKAEGFQKFYNAVISPTHVRVTAGGRIVPNTRGSHSPSVKWARERNPADTGAHGRVVSGFQTEGIPYPILPPAWGHYAPMVPAHAPGFAPGMAFRPDAFPTLPAPVAYNMPGAYAMHPLPFNPFAVPNPQPPPPPPPQQSGSAAQMNKQNGVNAPDQAKSIPLAPAEQFDPTRPFFYNGQWLMAHGNHLVPYGVMPQHGFAPAIIPNPPVPRPSADANMAHNDSPRKPEQSPERQSQASPPWTLDTVSSVAAPVSSIRPSSITMKQLGVLRSQKKYHEDQIQYNKHQIDHKDMELRLRHICSEIDHFQKMYENQLEFEDRTYPKIVNGHSGSSSGYAHSDAESESPAATRNGPSSAMKGNGARDRTKIRSVTAHNPSKSTTAIASVKAPIRSTSDRDTQKKPSSLPVNAALAPPFQPRAEKSYSSLMTAVPGPAASLKPDHLSRSTSQWRSYFKKPEVAKDYGTPYLTGKLAPGVQPENAQDTDYFYNRELTEDEHRARHLYWGKAPHHLQKGLPKYDGKHFYPPSPVKGNSTDTVESAVSEHKPLKSINESKPLTPKPVERQPLYAMDQAGPSAIRTRTDEVTRSESLHRAEDSLRGSSASELPRSESYLSQPSPRYLEFRRIVNEKTRIASEKQRARVEDDSGDEDGNLLFKGRRMMGRAVSTKHPNEIWSNMRRKGKTSANVVAGKVSPMTAQGVLPHYAGHASASLSPAIANTAVNPRGTKLGEPSDMPSANTAMEKQGENRPPLELLEQQLRSVSFQDKNFRGFPTR